MYNQGVRIPGNLNWKLTPRQAADEQRRLAQRVIEVNDFAPIRRVAGVDVGFEDDRTMCRAAAVVLTFPGLEPIDAALVRRPVTFPYVPGLLAFREIPAVLDALEQLKFDPNIVIVDGHGRAHPRRFGIACHLGVILDTASIGCAKTILVGSANTPEDWVGAWSPLIDKGELVGAAVRTRSGVAPIYVSIGHKVDLQTAIEVVGRCTSGFRLPDTTRYAHKVAAGATLSLTRG